MKKNVRNTIVGGLVGTGAGCLMAAVRTGVAFCPPLWLVGDVAGGALIGYELSNKKPVGAFIGAAAGVAIGACEIAVAPLSTAAILLQAPLYIPAGTIAGAVIGYKS